MVRCITLSVVMLIFAFCDITRGKWWSGGFLEGGAYHCAEKCRKNDYNYMIHIWIQQVMILWCKDSYTSTKVIRHLHVSGPLKWLNHIKVENDLGKCAVCWQQWYSNDYNNDYNTLAIGGRSSLPLRCHAMPVHADQCACAPMLYISELCEDCTVAQMKVIMREPASMTTDKGRGKWRHTPTAYEEFYRKTH